MNVLFTETELAALPSSECACSICAGLCTKNPGWLTPDEAQRGIDQGHAYSFMLDWWEPTPRLGNDERIYVISPAANGRRGDFAEDMPGGFIAAMMWDHGGCSLLKDGKCTIHDKGFKPVECRVAHHEKSGASSWDVRASIAAAWGTEKGRALVARWREIVALEGEPASANDWGE